MIYIDGNSCPYTINITKVQNLRYPPTVNRAGKSRGPNDIKTILTVETDMVKVPTLITSDLHSHTQAVLNDLGYNDIDISKYLVLTLGDMAGEGIFGSDGDPTEFYKRISLTSQLYLVQGNHDLPPENIEDLMELKNQDKTPCYISDGEEIYNTPNGTIGGVHGTISLKKHPYKKLPETFYALLENVLKWKKPDIIMTHETPEISYSTPDNSKVTKLIGKEELFQMITKYKPKIHMYGHCHHPFAFIYTKRVMFINADARILLLHPLQK